MENNLDKMLTGIYAYDPSEVNFTVETLEGLKFSPYGYSEGIKIWYEDDSLFISLQTTSEANKTLSTLTNQRFRLSLTQPSVSDITALGSILNGKLFRLSLVSFELGDRITNVVWKFSDRY